MCGGAISAKEIRRGSGVSIKVVYIVEIEVRTKKSTTKIILWYIARVQSTSKTCIAFYACIFYFILFYVTNILIFVWLKHSAKLFKMKCVLEMYSWYYSFKLLNYIINVILNLYIDLYYINTWLYISFLMTRLSIYFLKICFFYCIL